MSQDASPRMNHPPAESHAPEPSRSLSLTVFLVLVTIASILGVFARGDNNIWGDVAVLEAIQRLDIPGLELVVRMFNTAFGTAGALLLAVVFIAVALLMHRPVFVLKLVIVIVLRLVGQVLKPIFDSPRPGLEYQPDPELVSSTMGYPSGHAYTATVITTMFALFVLSLGVSPVARRLTILVAVLITAFGMFSRIWIGAHWPSDTIGGVLYGLATVALMHVIVSLIRPRAGQRSSTPA